MIPYIVYTDGACDDQHTGGYGCIIMQEDKIIKRFYQGFTNTTNNRMEILGVLVALKAIETPSDIIIYSDSQYVVQTINERWCYRWFIEKDYSKANLDLWFEIIDYLEYHHVTMKWVKGHNNDKYNELVDLLAVHARTSLNLKRDEIHKNKTD